MLYCNVQVRPLESYWKYRFRVRDRRYIEELLTIRESLVPPRSLSTSVSAGRHGGDSLEAYIW